ncbi:metal ABC transporter permease [Haloferula rosea]|uniref:Metal ABC transporter permease n=1 Tax=Haloferula rosea TaxID=490093 RepID=A0A934VA56_9BACT|nr:metal ABC transporter permease [Haloferula rosea]MBK1825948.1 metal ABC transporter permease [Haloferula rosea]
MNWTSFDTWLVVTAALCAVACALPGCFLVLRKMSMMGDAISHAVLPGIAVAFIISGSRDSLIMFLGAAIVGVLTAVFTQWISRFGHVDRGAAMGIVFTTLFALGLLLIVRAADHVDLDPGCVLYGAIEFTPLDTIEIGPVSFPRAALVLTVVLLLNLAIIALLFKELRLSSFDPSLADTLGYSSQALHYLLMTMVAVTTVAAFEAVGSIIVIAMLIVPPATALLLTHRLIPMILIACVVAVLSALLGHLGALTAPSWFGFEATTSSGMMAFAAGVLFFLAWCFSPSEGQLIVWLRHRKGPRDLIPPPEIS